MNIKDDLEKTLARSIVKIIQEPLLYFSEADVQQELCDSIKTIKSLKKLYPTAVRKGKNSKTSYKTSAVHREYGIGDNSRMDITILNPKNIKYIDSPNLTTNNKYLKIEYGIEVGTEKSPDTFTHLKNDISKLKKCKKIGYLIYIFKDITQAQSGSKSRDRTEEKIKNNFKNVIADNLPLNGKIKVITVLLRCYRNQVRMRGKCEIFVEGEWKKVNVNNKNAIYSTILQVMK